MRSGMVHMAGTGKLIIWYILVFVFLAVTTAGRRFISWVLMRFYEIFIHRNPLLYES